MNMKKKIETIRKVLNLKNFDYDNDLLAEIFIERSSGRNGKNTYIPHADLSGIDLNGIKRTENILASEKMDTATRRIFYDLWKAPIRDHHY